MFEGVRPGERAVATDEEARAAGAGRKAAETRIGEIERALARLTTTLRQRVLSRDGGAAAGGPSPFARWTFQTDGRDVLGALHGDLAGGAVITGGGLKLDGKAAHARTAPLARDLGPKTLEAWVALPTRKQGGGGVLSIETAGGAVFDALVFAERQPDKWIAGSDSFHRTRDLAGPEETAAPGELGHVAAA